MKALDVAANWNVDLETRIEELLGNRPELPMDFNEFAPATARRDLQVDYNMKATGGVGLLQSIKTQHNDE